MGNCSVTASCSARWSNHLYMHSKYVTAYLTKFWINFYSLFTKHSSPVLTWPVTMGGGNKTLILHHQLFLWFNCQFLCAGAQTAPPHTHKHSHKHNLFIYSTVSTVSSECKYLYHKQNVSWILCLPTYTEFRSQIYNMKIWRFLWNIFKSSSFFTPTKRMIKSWKQLTVTHFMCMFTL
jgi:hypothetical protein